MLGKGIQVRGKGRLWQSEREGVGGKERVHKKEETTQNMVHDKGMLLR